MSRVEDIKSNNRPWCFYCSLCDKDIRSWKLVYFDNSAVNLCEECYWNIHTTIKNIRSDLIKDIFKEAGRLAYISQRPNYGPYIDEHN